MTQLPVYRLCRACVNLDRSLDNSWPSATCHCLSRYHESRVVTRVAHVQLLVDNSYVYG